MKHTKFLFFISVRRAGMLSTINTLLLCFLIPLGFLITGCGEGTIGDSDRDLDDLLKEDLNIYFLDIDKPKLKIGSAIKLEVKLKDGEDKDKKADLNYHWHVNGGEIHGTGEKVIYVAKKEGTYTIICEVSNGVVTASDYCEVIVTGPEQPDTQKSSNESINNADGSGE